MACRFPGAPNIERFWQNLQDGVESVSRFSDEELRQGGVAAALLANGGYVKAAAILDDIAAFDARFFGFSPQEAALMDPQHRVFIECAWEALEDAGYNSQGRECLIG